MEKSTSLVFEQNNELSLNVSLKYFNPFLSFVLLCLLHLIDTQTSQHHKAEQRGANNPAANPEAPQPRFAVVWHPRHQATAHHQRGAYERRGVRPKLRVD